MKSFILTIFFVLVAGNLHAQIEKKSILIGGLVNYYGSDGKEDIVINNSSYLIDESLSHFLTIRPQIGFFTSPSTLLGIGFLYSFERRENQSIFDGVPNEAYLRKINKYLLNPYFTKFVKISDKLYFTATANLLSGFGKRKRIGTNGWEFNTFEIGAYLTPGLSYFLTQKWVLTGNIGHLFYSFEQEKLGSTTMSPRDEKNIFHRYGVRWNTLDIGVQYYLH